MDGADRGRGGSGGRLAGAGAAGLVQRRIGTRGEAIVVRFMGLVLVAVGAQLVLGGIAEFFGMIHAVPAGH